MLPFPARLRRLIFVLFLCAWPVAHAAAQSQATTAEVNGRVIDAQGGALPGVAVTAKNPDTGYTRTVTTNEQGLYLLPLLPPGIYDVMLELTGFTSTTRRIALTVGASVTYNHTLQLSSIAESVTVTAATPLVETTSTVRSSTVPQAAINDLPINGRRFQDFMTLTPTVQVDPSRGQLSFAGQRGINANVSVDGADYNQPFFGGIRGGERSNNAFTVPQEAIQEFQVVAVGYSAEFGRSTGGPRQRDHEVRHEQHARVGLLREPQPRLGREERVRPERRADAAAVRRIDWRPDQRATSIFFFGAYEQQLFKNTRQRPVRPPRRLHAACRRARRRSTSSSAREPFDATNDAQTLLGRVDFQLAGASRLRAALQLQQQQGAQRERHGNALDPNTISALTNNGTEKDSTNIVRRRSTPARCGRTCCSRRAASTRARSGRAWPTTRWQPSVQTVIGNYGTVSFLAEQAVRLARAGAPRT